MDIARRIACLAACCAALLAPAAPSRGATVLDMPAGQTSLQFVPVGDAGNAPDTGGQVGHGSVAYPFLMGKYEVTCAQYCQFLNSVAHADPYWLYSTSNGIGHFNPVIRTGNWASYSYSVFGGWDNMAMPLTSWGDAARFANWLSNGQPDTGFETPATTESGSYVLNGASGAQLQYAQRSASASYVVPSLDEWYKAAYYKGGSLDAGYWAYPTQSDASPSNVLSPTGTNNANFNNTDPVNGETPVGAFAGSPGPYGTFDMAGNVFEWTEQIHGYFYDEAREVWGGCFGTPAYYLASSWATSWRVYDDSSYAQGFRIAEVPEPSIIGIFALVCIGSLGRRRRARR